jgi:LysR family transcriptional regulator, transcriptional activator of the cysJI operon
MIFDFRLKVFYAVAQKLSFTKAAQELFITQPAVTRHINELEQQLGTGLFKRQGNTIALTPAGEVLAKYARQIFQTYALLENELAQLSKMEAGNIRIGASTTVGLYVIPGILALFRKAYPSIQISFFQGNSEWIEQRLMNEEMDIGIVEGHSHHPQIDYQPLAKDEIVLVTRSTGKWAKRNELRPEELPDIPLVLRESGSGTLDVVYRALAKVNMHPKDLRVEMQLESTESIKQYLQYADCAAFLSIHSITNELRLNQLRILDISDVAIYRTFQFIQLHGSTARLPELFKRFCLSHYNAR